MMMTATTMASMTAAAMTYVSAAPMAHVTTAMKHRTAVMTKAA